MKGGPALRFGFALVLFACAQDGQRVTLEQVQDDARPGPADGDAGSDAAPDGDDVTSDGEVGDGGDGACTDDGECMGAVACQVGLCVEQRCRFEAAPDATGCDDGDPCTTVDQCSAGACLGSGLLSCADGDPCSDDRCSPGVGCAFLPRSCDDGDACTNDTCRADVGCVATPIACDDGEACTEDVCQDGACIGIARGCDDDNPCTSDGCLTDGGCFHVPLVGCANNQECVGREAGAECDDGDAGSRADMCLVGSCRGFVLTRIAGTLVGGMQGLVVSEVDDGADGWAAVLRTVDFLFAESWLLAGLDEPASPLVFSDTVQDARFAGLRDGLVGDGAGRLWQLSSGGWSASGIWDEALAASGRAPVSAIFSVRGSGGARLVWLAGGAEREWVRACKLQGQSVTCSAQVLGSQEGASLPRAIAGVPACNGGGNCNGAELAIGADAWVGGGFNYTDVYVNPSGFSQWGHGFVPDGPANRATRAAAGWSSADGERFIVVGDNGYLLVRRTDGSWRGPLGLKDGQSSRDFSGVWVGAGVALVSATRLGSAGTTVAELWVAPLGANLEQGGNWTVHELDRFEHVDGDGIYDVHGRGDGEVRAVGAQRRADSLLDWLDGAVWVRSP